MTCCIRVLFPSSLLRITGPVASSPGPDTKITLTMFISNLNWNYATEKLHGTQAARHFSESWLYAIHPCKLLVTYSKSTHHSTIKLNQRCNIFKYAAKTFQTLGGGTKKEHPF